MDDNKELYKARTRLLVMELKVIALPDSLAKGILMREIEGAKLLIEKEILLTPKSYVLTLNHQFVH